ncbi:hypothetical protein F511_02587 [Dorcoceras hygrometricum]|uniref:Uncharacterized protein n=1 Tax=Dorcoceras hygrometricum TaxID=472368 RepID=A0A2Z7AN41_9LAMI|nr:hypothetical protein F511_02587 [Dorcoceras hygrometricum]
MAETQENPILAFFSNLFRGIQLPRPNNDAAVEPPSAATAPVAEPVEQKPAVIEDEAPNPSSVNFPRQEPAPLKLETEPVEAEPNTNPILLWQVYAIGGFFILRWAWTRWNERKGSKKPGNEPPTNPDDL